MLEEERAIESAGPVFDPPVYIQRYTTVRDILYKLPNIEKVADFGCANGKFIKYLKKLPFVREIVGLDLSDGCLNEAACISKPIAFEFLFKRHRSLAIKIFKGSAAEKDQRLQGFDAITCIELIEHLEEKALKSLPENIFGYIHPRVAIFTTPNSEFNILFPGLKGFRHWDHRFEWTRNEFSDWCSSIIKHYPEYSVTFRGIGEAPEEHKHLGCCTQMAIFRLKGDSKSLVDTHIEDDQNNEPYILIAQNNYPGREQENMVDTSEENKILPTLNGD